MEKNCLLTRTSAISSSWMIVCLLSWMQAIIPTTIQMGAATFSLTILTVRSSGVSKMLALPPSANKDHETEVPQGYEL